MPVSISESLPLVLGSASPRRREILANLRIPFRVLPADVPEEVRPDEAPEAFSARIVSDKLAGVAGRARAEARAALLVADTIVVVDGDILNKPSDYDDAERLLGRIVGRSHIVFTRYAIGAADGALLAARTVESEVWLRAASAAEIRGYARTGEGLDKAGAYAIQGIGAFLIERIRGSYTNVVGLPACEVVSDLLAAGLLESFP
ncbi:MAG TPA: nucleoside triphosphate pyrophosphatase [Polyangiaceae bacterium]